MRFLVPRTLTAKLNVYVGLATCALLVLTVWTTYSTARQVVESQANSEGLKQVQAGAEKLDDFVSRIAEIPNGIAARHQSLTDFSAPATVKYLAHVLNESEIGEAYAVYIAFDRREWTDPASMLRVDRRSWPGAVPVTYNYKDARWDWYNTPKRTGEIYVSEPFFAAGGANVMLVSITKPVYDERGAILGVAGVDVPLEHFREIVARIQFRADSSAAQTTPPAGQLPEEFAFLVSRSGRLVAHPSEKLLAAGAMGEEVTNPADGEAAAESVSGTASITMMGRSRRVFWATARGSGWKVALNFPESVILRPVTVLAWRIAIIGGLSFILMVAVVTLVARRLAEPIRELTRAAGAIENENYDLERLTPTGRRKDEIGRLARGFQRMAREVNARTQRLREAEEALRRSEQHFRSLIEHSSDVIALVDSSGTVVYGSPSVEKALGYAGGAFTGHKFLEFIHPQDMALFSAAFAPARSHLEVRMRNAAGQWRLFEADSTNLIEEPSVRGIIINARDITERKRALDLERDKEAADAANQAKSQFLANMSHELRTPLNAIIGYTEMLQEEATDLGQDQFIPDLQKIHAAGRHLLELINAVLDISKIEAGKMELYLESFSVAKLVDDVASIIQPLIKKNANAFRVETAGDPGFIHADLTKVRQALFNLLSNAAKFTERGVITLGVERAGDRIRFRVTDTGIGMTEEHMSRLFEAFSQADSSMTRRFGGTGLGLVISRRFCHMMGGDITVSSTIGEGTCFTMDLPVAVTVAGDAQPAREENAAVADGASLVLVIDDDARVHDLLRRSLAREGFRVETAFSGEEGIRKARALNPDAITLDVMMPGADGWTVLSQIKSDPALHDIPVVMLTIVDDQNRGYSLGAADYLTKPIDRDRLTAMLRRLGTGPNAKSALIVEDDADARDLLRSLLSSHGWSVTDAANGRLALDALAAMPKPPGIILLDLMMPEMNGFEFLDELRKRPEWSGIAILVVTAKDLTAEDRLRLNGHVGTVLQKGHYSAGELLSETGRLVASRIRGAGVV